MLNSGCFRWVHYWGVRTSLSLPPTGGCFLVHPTNGTTLNCLTNTHYILFKDWTARCGSFLFNVQSVLGKTRCSYKIIIHTIVKLNLILFQSSGALLDFANIWKSKKLNINDGMPFFIFRNHTPRGRYFCAATESGAVLRFCPDGVCLKVFNSHEESLRHARSHIVHETGQKWVPVGTSAGRVLGGYDDMLNWTVPGWVLLMSQSAQHTTNSLGYNICRNREGSQLLFRSH